MESKRQVFSFAASSGFSLVEVTVALAITSFAMLAVFGLLPLGMKTFQEADSESRLSRHGQDWLTRAQQTDFSSLAGLEGEYYYDDQGIELETEEEPRRLVTVNVTVNSAVTLPGFTPTSDTMVRVLVEVTQPGREPVVYTALITRTDSRIK